jgi:predicted TIM-barrel fold metal-dependent hydrolase
MSITTLDGEVIEVIDSHTHMGGRPRRQRFEEEMKDAKAGRAFFNSFDAKQVLAAMAEGNVDTAIGFPMGGFSTEYDYSDQNDMIADAMKQHPGKIIGFCRINPNVGEKAATGAVEHYIKDRGMKGIKLHPEIDHFNLDERTLAPIFDKARDLGAVIIFHSGNTANTDPLIIGELAAQYPKVPVILGHMGLYEGCRKAARAAEKIPNLYLETSTCAWMSHHFAPAVLKVGYEKVLYGSDHPYNPFQMEIDKLVKYAVRYTGWTKKELKMVLGGNIKRILGAS